MDSIGTVSICPDRYFYPRRTNPTTDWAYLEEWCRRLTGTFADVYVFTIPLYLPRLEADGKWRVVSTQYYICPLWCI